MIRSCRSGFPRWSSSPRSVSTELCPRLRRPEKWSSASRAESSSVTMRSPLTTSSDAPTPSARRYPTPVTTEPHWVITLRCADRPGIVHAVSGAIVAAGGNITESMQFYSSDTEPFFMRIQVALAVRADLEAELESVRDPVYYTHLT